MSAPDNESDYEDEGFDFSGDEDEELDEETLIWQLLLLINPGDEDTALQQFARFREAREEAGEDGTEAVDIVQDVIDWTSGYHVDWKDTESFIDSIAQLASRWNLRVDWGVEDPTDDEFLDRTDVPELMSIAHDRLREHGYTVWNRDTGGDAYAGWIALRRDDENMQAVAAALGIDIRPGSDAF
ncbi:DUF6630 family protein [Lysobacter sp. CA199]|uniref:DUF6630 family protein n=1 Tax=Lysobacter sp. CA199 TaxID=3455608 RepID=UPI003F8D5B72